MAILKASLRNQGLLGVGGISPEECEGGGCCPPSNDPHLLCMHAWLANANQRAFHKNTLEFINTLTIATTK